MEAKSGWTEIYIYPGYRFKVTDALVTNFHLPESTLIMLVSAFAGREHVLAAYQEAVRERQGRFCNGEQVRVYDRERHFIGIYRYHAGKQVFRVEKMFLDQEAAED